MVAKRRGNFVLAEAAFESDGWVGTWGSETRLRWGARPMEETIPLEEGSLSAPAIIPDRSGIGVQLRGRRTSSRKSFEGVWVVFSPETRPGHVDHVECPLLDLSGVGIAVQYDRPLKAGVHARIAYRSVCDVPINVPCTVRRCVPLEGGGYRIGAQFDVKLRVENRRPARARPGRELVPGIRARRIAGDGSRQTLGPTATEIAPSAMPVPHGPTEEGPLELAE